MKNKKVIAIALSIGIFTSSFSGTFICFAKNDTIKSNISDFISKNDYEKNTKLASGPNLVHVESDLNNHGNMSVKTKGNGESETIYKSNGKVLNNNSPQADDTFNIDKDEIIELVDQGYSIQDILKADELSNEIYVDPKLLLENKTKSGKSLDEVKADVIKERKEELSNQLKTKYEKEYEKLSNKYNENEIISLLSYLDINNIQLTDELIVEYKNYGKKLFKKQQENQVSEEMKKKYKLSDKEVEGITKDEINAMEELSKKTNKPVKELLKSYKNSIN